MKRFGLFMLLSGLLLSSVCAMERTDKDISAEVQPVNDRARQVRDRGEMLHWQNLQDYLSSRGERPKKLVVGCGHGAFWYNEKTGDVRGMHGKDSSSVDDSSDDSFSHCDAFTINAYDGKFGPRLYSDIDGFFPGALPKPATGIFDEIFFENVDGGTSQFYAAAFQYLNPGGRLVDDRYTADGGSRNYRKSIAIEKLIEAGFSDIQFEDNVTNPRNNRKGSHLVIATKLKKVSQDRSAFEADNPILKMIDAEVTEMKKSGDFTNVKLNSYLRGYYRNVPEMFKMLYFKYKIPVTVHD